MKTLLLIVPVLVAGQELATAQTLLGADARRLMAIAYRLQEGGSPPTDPSQVPPPAQPAPIQPPAGRHWSVGVIMASVYDSNIDRDERGQDSYGFVVGTAIRYQSAPTRPLFQLNYELAGHSYQPEDQWNRLSNHLTLTFERRLTRRLTLDAIGDVSLNGTSEDRELSDEFLVRPRMEFRVTNAFRARVYGAYRLKRYEENVERDATNHYVGVEFQQRMESGNRWETGLRYEVNDGRGPRYQYVRWTYANEYLLNVTQRDTVAVDIKYRFQHYWYRLVELDDVDVPRRDHRWIPSVSWVHRFGSNLDLSINYNFETRFSNDLDKDFSAHSTSISVMRRW